MSDQNFRAILTGSFSTPCKDNPTGAMIEAAWESDGTNARYVNCDVKPENLASAVAGAKAMEWVGFNCSMPHKVSVIQHLDGVTDAAKLIGAVNCVSISDGKLTGDNTDGKGFLESLKSVTDPAGKRVLLLGAGGAARAIAVELGLAGAASVAIASRDVSKAEEIAKLLAENTKSSASALPWDGDIDVPEGIEILINATPVGLGDAEAMPDVNVETLGGVEIVADVIFNPPKTRLLRTAAKKGCTTLDGLGMLVNQGVIGVEQWMGKKPDAQVMAEKLKEIFGA
ncbi:shikimate 5-dehydrogenase [Acetobacter nitrogenifigens DSM 23921 = NBRC 105050]|uniref:Shikimate dehydrogenase (NADP(+)) n=1 Tax=Acetobacter nitrogenifigens DSM 23921 = NBRC 105050 TaxID=1120919 RepID=A0A511X5J5_9PROT|nr:shikimate dehydrogenase [Acetobacter nitrogenifigens]GBQ98231.1 shikimate 5-dehydrogenase [Acetobacter nitrogenifigens DSM 23921 = NBRC 105050]GEN58204.1 shikimate dehydrogenase (NADP(+)) [Acetobacter nitrogenifigens DSM 23921 = NBRC 105050]